MIRERLALWLARHDRVRRTLALTPAPPEHAHAENLARQTGAAGLRPRGSAGRVAVLVVGMRTLRRDVDPTVRARLDELARGPDGEPARLDLRLDRSPRPPGRHPRR